MEGFDGVVLCLNDNLKENVKQLVAAKKLKPILKADIY